MSKFCSECGCKFKPSDKFCPECGKQKITKSDLALIGIAKRSSLSVFILQIVLFPVFPFVYMFSLFRKLKLRHGFIRFNYHLWYMAVISIIASVYLKYLWLFMTSSPSEHDLLYGFSNIFIILPYLIWFFLNGLFYLISIIITVKKVNEILPVENRVNLFWAIVLGCFYIQHTINKSSSVTNNITLKKPTNQFSFFRVIAYGIPGLILLSFTGYGHQLLSYAVGLVDGTFSEVAEKATMDYQAKYTLAQSNPSFASMDQVALVCKNDKDTILSLGCNLQNGEKFTIYVSKVNEPALSGIETYSVAHEMLHTVYAKLSSEERTSIDNALKEAYEKVKISGDTYTKDAIKPYEGVDQETLLNELHSILPLYGAGLNDTLEVHYKRYFKDRTKLASSYKASEKILIDAETNVKNFLDSLKMFEDNLNNGSDVIGKQKDNLDYYVRVGNIYAYNSLVSTYNNNIDLYNSNYAKYSTEYDNYKKAYANYLSLYTSLRRNVSYEQATAITAQTYRKEN